MLEDSSFSIDLGKVFIPCRTVLEMEALTSLYLATSNYDKIKEVPESLPTSQQLIDILGVKGNPAHERIIDFFINVAVEKLKPVVMYAREHHDRYRMGNVLPYTKTRVCVFFALHRLKFKFLIINNFIKKLKEYEAELSYFYIKPVKEAKYSLLSTLYKFYVERNKINLEEMLPKEKVSERVRGLMDDKDSMTNEKLLQMATYTFYSEEENIIKFIMREIKASLFVCNLMLAKLDVNNPFIRGKETQIDEEEFMISNDFIPELLPAMDRCVAGTDYYVLFDFLAAFDFMMERVLDGINYAYETISGGQIQLDLDETLYSTGYIFEE
jgi:hypothetical protein